MPGLPWRSWCAFCAKTPEEFTVNKFSDLRNSPELHDVVISCFSEMLDKRVSLPTCLDCHKFIGDLKAFTMALVKTRSIFDQMRRKRRRGGDEEIMEVVEDKPEIYEIIIDGEEETRQQVIVGNCSQNDDEVVEEVVVEEEEQEPSGAPVMTVPLTQVVNRRERKKRVKKEVDLNISNSSTTKEARDKPFVCQECGKSWASKGGLKEHMIIHSEERPFACSKCPKTFKNLQRLRIHEDTHDNTGYICPECGLQLNTKRTLTMHMVVHSEVKRFKCEFCGNEYKRAKALKAHLIIHTGLRPYSCPFCDKTFVNGSNCRTHKRKAHPELLAALEAAMPKDKTNRDGTKAKVLPSLNELKNNLNVKVSDESEIQIIPYQEADGE